MLTKLKEYKELLTIIVFFLSGVFWIQKQYPTKGDLKAEVRVVNCLLQKYMLLTQLQIRGRDVERRAQELMAEISLYGDEQDPSRPTMSPAMRHELEAKRQELADLRRELRSNASEVQKTGEELARNVCGGVAS